MNVNFSITIDRKSFEKTLDEVLKHCKNSEIADIAEKTNLLEKLRKQLHGGSDYKFVAETIGES